MPTSQPSSRLLHGLHHAATEHECAALKTTQKLLTSAQWCVENRWLWQQPHLVRKDVLIKMLEHRMPLNHIDVYVVTDVLFETLCNAHDVFSSTNTSSIPEDDVNLFDVSPNTYSLLLTKITDAQLPVEQLRFALHAVLQQMWRLLVGTETCPARMVFTRAHVLLFYERMVTQLVRTTDNDPTHERFTCMVTELAEMFKPLRKRNTAPSQMRSYRATCLRKIYRMLVHTVFGFLCHRGRFAELDVLFHHNRTYLTRVVRTWLVSINAADVEQMWATCTHVRAHCIANVFKLETTFRTNPALWSKCETHSDTGVSALTTCEDADLLAHWTRTVKEHVAKTSATPDAPIQPRHLMQLMRKYALSTQRKLLVQLFRVFATLPDPVRSEPFHVFVRKHSKYVLRVTSCDESALRYYIEHTTDHVTLLTTLCPLLRANKSHFGKWLLVCDAFPLAYLTKLTTRTHQQLDKHLSESPVNTTTHSSVQVVMNGAMSRTLRQYRAVLHEVLQHPLGQTEEPVNELLHAVSSLVKHHRLRLRATDVRTFRHFVRCVLVLWAMQRAPVVSNTNEPPDADGYTCTTTAPEDCTCAICYNDVDAPFHVLPCGHVFHTDCMLKMVQHSSQALHELDYVCKCPYCMKPLLTKETIYEDGIDLNVRRLLVWLYDAHNSSTYAALMSEDSVSNSTSSDSETSDATSVASL